LLAALLGAAGAIAPAAADIYPSRPITVIVPYPAGGPTDALMRILSERMRMSLGQPFVIENVTGASGTIAVGRVVRAEPDGYTVSIGNTATHVTNGATFALKYDLLTDLKPVALLPATPFLIISKAAIPAKTLKELMAWLKAQPVKTPFGIPGVGSLPHVAGLQLEGLAGAHFEFVPYRGAAPALQDLVAGQIDVMIDQPLNSLAQVNAGKVRAYAVTAPARLASAPDVPTVDEAGVPSLHASVWNGFWVPKDTSSEIIAKLNAAAVDALADADVRRRLAELGLEIPPRDQQTPEALGAFQKAEIERWWPILKAANIKVE
jgi:tripartite-type tricarboxylate transporter receptor subunit TctC